MVRAGSRLRGHPPRRRNRERQRPALARAGLARAADLVEVARRARRARVPRFTGEQESPALHRPVLGDELLGAGVGELPAVAGPVVVGPVPVRGSVGASAGHQHSGDQADEHGEAEDGEAERRTHGCLSGGAVRTGSPGVVFVDAARNASGTGTCAKAWARVRRPGAPRRRPRRRTERSHVQQVSRLAATTMPVCGPRLRVSAGLRPASPARTRCSVVLRIAPPGTGWCQSRRRRGAASVGCMVWTWRYEDGNGNPVDRPGAPREEFPTQADAESWLGETWLDLLAGGVDQVTLLDRAGRLCVDEPAPRRVAGPASLSDAAWD